MDRDGCHFTKSEKYTVKSGYQVERIYPDRVRPPLLIGPTVDVLKAFCWKIRCPPKLKHFLWQLVTWCITVKKNLQGRWIQGDICCARCGAHEESVNHVFLNVLQHFRFGLSRRYHQIQKSFQQVLYSHTWIISSGEFYHIQRIISFLGFYGTYRNVVIIKFSVIWILIPWIRLNWQKQSQHYGLRHKF